VADSASGPVCALAKHYGFTNEELDFIPSVGLRAGINHDPSATCGFATVGTSKAGSQYRMGRNVGDGESEADGER
jgi:hypothetical protein